MFILFNLTATIRTQPEKVAERESELTNEKTPHNMWKALSNTHPKQKKQQWNVLLLLLMLSVIG